MLLKLYYIVIILYGISFAQQLLGSRKTEFGVAVSALICNGAVIILITIQSGHFPFFNIFESMMFVTFLMGATGLFFIKDNFSDVRLWIWLEILLLLVITLFSPKEPSPPLYNHNCIYIVLFFGFRYATLAFMMCATAYYIRFLLKETRETGQGIFPIRAGIF